MSAAWRKHFQATLHELRDANQLRRKGLLSEVSPIDFGSNDYLGLRSHPKLRHCIAELSSEGGMAWGSGASPVLNGYTSYHASLERSLCELTHSEAAAVFSSGYSANVGSLACLAGPTDAIYSDQLNHASLIDGMRLSRAEKVVYPHLATEFLESHLAANRHRYERVLLVTESVFSMDGDCADLAALSALAAHYDCGLIVDEAHATGVFGVHGGGMLEELQLDATQLEPLVLKLGTLSKAIGGIGGFAAASQEAISYLVNRCRSFLFSTSPPAITMQAAVVAIDLLKNMHAERQRLREMSTILRDRLRSAGFTVPVGQSPIVPIVLGGEREAMDCSQRLLAAGFYVPAIRPPTVPAGTSRLRISLSIGHTDEMLGQLCDALCGNRMVVNSDGACRGEG